MRKPAFCICENEGADQVTAQLINAIDSTMPLLPNTSTSYIHEFKHLLTLFCGCTARFVSDLVGNPEDIFSRDAAHFSRDSSRLIKLHISDLVNMGLIHAVCAANNQQQMR